MYSLIKLKFICATNVGLCRDNNEDNYAVGLIKDSKVEFFRINDPFTLSIQEFEVNEHNSIILGLADGMGGANAGEVASQIAMDIIELSMKKYGKIPEVDNDRAFFIREIILNGHDNIILEAKRDPSKKGMGTTEVIACISNQGLTVGWSGDSRMYEYSHSPLLQDKDPRLGLNHLRLITRDHSLVWDLVEDGEISAEEARNHHLSHVITQSLGSREEKPNPELRFSKLYEGNRYLLCTDGLNGMLTEPKIETILSSNSELSVVANSLIEEANSAGGHDNISLILFEVNSIKEPPPEYLANVSQYVATTANQAIGQRSRNKANLNFGIVSFLLVMIAGLCYFIWTTLTPALKDKIFSALNVTEVKDSSKIAEVKELNLIDSKDSNSTSKNVEAKINDTTNKTVEINNNQTKEVSRKGIDNLYDSIQVNQNIEMKSKELDSTNLELKNDEQ